MLREVQEPTKARRQPVVEVHNVAGKPFCSTLQNWLFSGRRHTKEPCPKALIYVLQAESGRNGEELCRFYGPGLRH